MARAPNHVLDRAKAELIANWIDENAGLYNMTAEEFADYISKNWDSLSLIDSPLENLAVLKDAINGVTTIPGVTPDIDLMAIALGMASDKNVAVTEDTVKAVATILGVDPATLDVSTLAAKAEAVRQAALAGHG
ncbi:MAG: hypothetical protein C0605_03120 [Hyphomicrobiales bacterium]|nr:MAG: hypothetical protein C0605_03120 [Hyphomicrobiales bacterium]